MASQYAGLVQGSLRDLRGNALTGAVVIVKNAGTATLSTLYNNPVLISGADGGDALVNDGTTGIPTTGALQGPGVDAEANYTFYADSDLAYDLYVIWHGLNFTVREQPKVVVADSGGGVTQEELDDAIAGLSGTFVKRARVVVADAATITFDLDAGNKFRATLGGNRTIATANAVVGDTFSFVLNSGAGGFTPSLFPVATITWATGSPAEPSTAANKDDEYVVEVRGLTDYVIDVVHLGVAGPPTVPDAPTAVVGTEGNAQASIAFSAPSSDGGSAITGYTVTVSPGSHTASGPSSPIVVTGLTNGTAYTATVHAANILGPSAESSASSAFTPLAFSPLGLSPLCWVRADAGTTGATTDGQTVTAWVDQSGNGNNVPAVGATPAVLKTNIQNGKPVVRCDGVTAAFRLATWAGGAVAQPTTIFLIGIYRGALPPVSYQGILDGGGNFTQALRALASGIFEGEGAGAGVTGDSIALDHSVHLHTLVFNGGSGAVKADGTSQTTGNIGTATSNGITIGGISAIPPTACAQCDYCEIVVVPGVVSAPNQALMLTYAQTRWATP